MPGFKAFKERIIVFLGGNIAGYRLKHFVIWHTENPRAFKYINKHILPVYYRSNKMSWMTQILFQRTLRNYYAREMEKYCLENYTTFKILLIVGNAPRHPPFIGDTYPDIKVVFLTPNVTSLVQPMNQGVTAALKAYFLRKKTLMQFWKNYSVYDCIKNLAWAWDYVIMDCINDI